ncbi:MAG: hypothetical protein R3B69_00540 [Candidatus Paceibacterota bacterium]
MCVYVVTNVAVLAPKYGTTIDFNLPDGGNDVVVSGNGSTAPSI